MLRDRDIFWLSQQDQKKSMFETHFRPGYK